ncbi:MAG: nuclear transport factor 2 family protein [Planctomycetes bacterium]|nr:nuclear transport factor 2 family protein [Planctomycetota bacterium]
MKMLTTLALLLFTACASPRGSSPSREAEVMQADRQFAWDVQQRRLDAWVEAFDAHGSQVDEQGAPVTGHDAIRAYMQGAFADIRFELEWAPVEARVPDGGNLGFVWGHWTLRSGAEESHGRYLDIWKRGADGKWKLLFDVGEGAPKN